MGTITKRNIPYIKKSLYMGVTKKKIAEHLKVAISTLNRFIKQNKLNK